MQDSYSPFSVLHSLCFSLLCVVRRAPSLTKEMALSPRAPVSLSGTVAASPPGLSALLLQPFHRFTFPSSPSLVTSLLPAHSRLVDRIPNCPIRWNSSTCLFQFSFNGFSSGTMRTPTKLTLRHACSHHSLTVCLAAICHVNLEFGFDLQIPMITCLPKEQGYMEVS